MSDDGWRARIRWVVVHPDREAVLVARRDGAIRLPEAEQPGQVWTADPAEVLPGLRDLLGADAVLLRCLEEDEDSAARDACVAHPFLDLVTIRRGTSFAEGEAGSEAELRARLRAAYLPTWAAFEPPERLDRAYRLAGLTAS